MTEALQISLLGITFPTSLINASVILEERVTFDVKPVNIIGLSRRQDLGLTIQRISYMLKKEKKVTSDLFGGFSDYIVYEGRQLKGWPVKTIVRGELVAEDFEVIGNLGHGKLVERTTNIPKK